MHNSFKLKKNSIFKFYTSYNFLKQKDDFVTMCKYINFNNLRKKKGFAGGGVMVGWNSLLWKYKKNN